MTFRPQSLESKWKVFQGLIGGSGFSEETNSSIFLYTHPYIHLSSHPAVPGASPAKRCWGVSSKPLAYWWTQTCMSQGPAVTKATRVDCLRFRIIRMLQDGDKSLHTPGTVPWGRRLVIIGWKATGLVPPGNY